MTEPPRLDGPTTFHSCWAVRCSSCSAARILPAMRWSCSTRILVITLIAWLPLLLLSVIGGSALGGGSRFHSCTPSRCTPSSARAAILIAAELVVHLRISAGREGVPGSRRVPPGEVPRFDAAIASVLRARNSVALELALVVVVYTLGSVLAQPDGHRGDDLVRKAGRRAPEPDSCRLLVTSSSAPIFQFILLRWYLRLFSGSLPVAGLRARPETHSHASGPGRGPRFPGQSTYAYSPILLAQGVLLSGQIAGRIFEQGANLIDFKVQIVGFVASSWRSSSARLPCSRRPSRKREGAG